MGLDMYLNAQIHLTDFRGEDKQTARLRKMCDTLGLPPDNAGEGNYGSIEIKTQAGYWRKANHIHRWFVENVQDGTDNCEEYYVSREKLIELRSVCRQVLAGSNLTTGPVHVGTQWKAGEREELIEMGKVVDDPSVAQELLPSQSGFFFGSEEYDEWYLLDVGHTIKVVDACLACPNSVQFYYQSSW